MTTHTPTPTLRDLALCLQALALEARDKLPNLPPRIARAVQKETHAASADLWAVTLSHSAGRTPDASALAAVAVRLQVAGVYLDSIAAPPAPPTIPPSNRLRVSNTRRVRV